MAVLQDHPDGLLWRLAVHDEESIESALGIRLDYVDPSDLDSKTCALVRIAALLATGAGVPAYQWPVDLALGAGATVEEIIGVVTAVAPSIGVARVVSAAPLLGLALGYDIESALEQPSPGRTRSRPPVPSSASSSKSTTAANPTCYTTTATSSASCPSSAMPSSPLPGDGAEAFRREADHQPVFIVDPEH